MTASDCGEKKKYQIMIVDDHPLIRQGIKHLIAEENDMMVVAELEDADEALAAIARHRPDLVIVDISLKRVSGLELIGQIKCAYPKLPTLVLSMHKETIYAERALKAGARGYVMKETAATDVLTAIREVLCGKIFLSDAMKDLVLERFTSHQPERQGNISLAENLTDRELEVLSLIGQGIKTREIAKIMKLSPKTVDSHCANIKSKLNLKNATSLIEYAVLWRNQA